MSLEQSDPALYDAIQRELKRQQDHLEMIASENFVSQDVLEAQGSVLTNKYAEGYPGKRFYGGCEFVDIAEDLARDRAKQLFNAEYVNVQPHSGSSANMSIYFSVLQPGDTILGMDLSHGGHLTHGSSVNFSGKMYRVVSYGVNKQNETIDYDQVMKLAREYKPKMIVCGASAYPRIIEFDKFREAADEVGAYVMADIAHIAGLVATGLHPSSIQSADFTTTTTHKTLRGPRGGMVMMGRDFENRMGIVAPKSGRVRKMSEIIDSTMMPGIQGGPLMHVIAAKAVALGEALKPEFTDYQKKIVSNAHALAEALLKRDFHLVSGGTDNHLLLLNLTNKKISGKAAEGLLGQVNITANKNGVPFDERSPLVTSGIRLGTPALTARGMDETAMKKIAELIDRTLTAGDDNDTELNAVKNEVMDLARQFPLYND